MKHKYFLFFIEELTFFNRKSCDGNKVRRQLYQTLDCSQKSLVDGKGNANKVMRLKKTVTQNYEERGIQNNLKENKNRESLLLPLDTIKTSFIRKSTSNFGQTTTQSIKSYTSNISKYTKRISNITEKEKLKSNVQKNICTERQNNVNIKIDFSASKRNKKSKNKLYTTKRDKYTMTSPSIDRSTFFNKSLSGISEFEHQSLVNDSSKLSSDIKYSNNSNPMSLGVQNLVSDVPGIDTEKMMVHNQSSQNSRFNFMNMNSLDCSNVLELKSFLEQSIQACENQTYTLRQTLNVVNNMLNVTTKSTDVLCINDLEVDEKSNVSNIIINSQNSPSTTNVVDNCLKNISIKDEESTLTTNICKVECTKNIFEVEENVPTCTNILFNNTELNKETNSSSGTLNDLVRLSTIGEVSYEGDELNKNGKDDSENKENVNVNANINVSKTKNPKNPKKIIQ
jgi:hypothetical protein